MKIALLFGKKTVDLELPERVKVLDMHHAEPLSDPSGAVFEALSDPIESRNGCFLLEYVNRQKVDMAEFEAISDSLLIEEGKKKRQNLWREWYRNVYESAVIEDYRDDIYGS